MEAVERQFTSHCKSRAGLERARSMRSCRNISGNWDVSIAKFRVPRNPSRTDVKRGDHFLQADFPGLIRAMPNWITSESPTIHELSLLARWRSGGNHEIRD